MRIARRVALCLMIGSALSVAVAWIVAVTVRPIGSNNRSGGQTVWSRPSGIGDGWSYWFVRDFGTLAVARIRAHFELQGELRDAYLEVRERNVPGWSGVHGPPTDDTDARQPMYLEDARGWPMLALWSETQIIRASVGPTRVLIDGGILIRSEPSTEFQRTILPLRPIWSGFVIDSLIYGAVALAILFGPGALRRAGRGRRGQCIRCGYDLRAIASATCPECGALRPRGEGAAG